MPNVFINALNLSLGGGKNILDNYLNELSRTELSHNYFILTPNFDLYNRFSNKRVHVVKIESFYNKKFYFILLYFYKFPFLFKKYKIDLVFNFGDVIIPTVIPQIYFFDWPYAVYSEKYIWGKMNKKDYVIRKMKLFLLQRFIHKPTLIIVQTKNIADRLLEIYGCKNIEVIATPLGFNQSYNDNFYEINLSQDKKYFFYPASYSTHKNFDMVFELLKLMNEKKVPFILILTLDLNVAAEFLYKIKLNSFDNVINLGTVNLEFLPSLYNQVDALFFPSLMETYGFPYIEAMSLGKPILTSNLDFAHALCDDVAFYFNPFDVQSMLDVMFNFDKDLVELNKRITRGKFRVDEIPKWKDVTLKFDNLINSVLRK
jgi:glycosyltransferase involved in cell wall biosynthesis